jgi:hypothetical protein
LFSFSSGTLLRFDHFRSERPVNLILRQRTTREAQAPHLGLHASDLVVAHRRDLLLVDDLTSASLGRHLPQPLASKAVPSHQPAASVRITPSIWFANCIG